MILSNRQLHDKQYDPCLIRLRIFHSLSTGQYIKFRPHILPLLLALLYQPTQTDAALEFTSETKLLYYDMEKGSGVHIRWQVPDYQQMKTSQISHTQRSARGYVVFACPSSNSDAVVDLLKELELC